MSFGIDLPGAETGEAASRGALTVEVGPGGETSVNGRNIAADRLEVLFRRESETGAGGNVTSMADRNTAHGNVGKIVDLARKTDLERLNIAVAPREDGPGS